MTAILGITAPVFLIIFLGFVAVRVGFIPQSALPGMSRFVLFVAMPALIFSKMSVLPISELLNLQYLIAFAVGCLGTFLIAFLLSYYLSPAQGLLSGIRGLGGAIPNSAFIGLPVMLQFFETPVTQGFAMVILVENIIVFPFALTVIEAIKGRSSSVGLSSSVLWPTALKVLKNPIILSVICGIVFSLLGAQLPGFAAQAITLLGAGSAPVALVVIGGSLVGISIRSSLDGIAIVSACKLLIHPLLVAFMVIFVFPDMELQLKQAAILFAASPMLSIYPIIGGQYGFQAFCAGALLVTTVLAFISISVVLSLLPYL